MRRGEGVSRIALALIILTGVREDMAAQARRKEFDLETKIWRIPKGRVKGIHGEFRVPLVDEVIVLLDQLNIRKLGPDEFVFPGQKANQPITGFAILGTLKRIDQRYTVHGFRSTLRTWGYEYEEEDFRQDIVEMALAHLTKAAKASGATSLEVWRAYQHGDALEKRRVLMEKWAKFVTAPKGDYKAPPPALRRDYHRVAASVQPPRQAVVPIDNGYKVREVRSSRECAVPSDPIGHADLTDPEWAAIEPLLSSSRGDERQIINGILWMQRSQRGFGEIPDVYGKRWTTYYKRFTEWRTSGVWRRILGVLDHSSSKSNAIRLPI